MVYCPESAVERATEVEQVILRAISQQITWWEAAEIIGISDRQMRRWNQRCQQFGYDGLYDRRLGRSGHEQMKVTLPRASGAGLKHSATHA